MTLQKKQKRIGRGWNRNRGLLGGCTPKYRNENAINIGRSDERSEMSSLSDAELIQQLSDTAKELGIKIDLNYSFAQQSSATETDRSE